MSSKGIHDIASLRELEIALYYFASGTSIATTNKHSFKPQHLRLRVGHHSMSSQAIAPLNPQWSHSSRATIPPSSSGVEFERTEKAVRPPCGIERCESSTWLADGCRKAWLLILILSLWSLVILSGSLKYRATANCCIRRLKRLNLHNDL
ncbi:hypothetical protein HYPSUDRAFT_1013857 [Hypholoma sublateritium FD-334 SS-4]|uniref:Uncharacterized protein n=1 Tax=Hypholoma sublateritium (strain FD-334 SS-4) TaxID=945553 RepID=A0A0D2KS75_HYPSF|nr:hypothetical protein HYPSUDRAFT_1013857 [Hypholoma sublateritium FD-334 SS-4]